MAKKPKILTEPHHRRPRSLGGTETPGNISNVTGKLHRHWHTLFGNMNAMQICDHINEMPQKPRRLEVICKFINGIEVKKTGESHSRKQMKITIAWNELFKDLTFKATINYINNTWLDPSYHLYTEKKKKRST
ncbi:MAG: hypothetical protein V4665_03085 [Patescibacteria group bacterium]